MERKLILVACLVSLALLPACGTGVGYLRAAAQNTGTPGDQSAQGTLVVKAQEIIEGGAFCIPMPGGTAQCCSGSCGTQTPNPFGGSFVITSQADGSTQTVQTDNQTGLSAGITVAPGSYEVAYQPLQGGAYSPLISSSVTVTVTVDQTTEADIQVTLEAP